MRNSLCWLAPIAAAACGWPGADRDVAFAAEVRVDCAQSAGTVRALHGVNNGPLNFGEVVDLSAYYRQAAFPLARLHDCEWPDPDFVDVHTIFPDLRADPNRPESYRFARTDAYVQAIVDAGVGIVYRLGESIEMTKRKYHVHPPADYSKWAAACVGIVRHYNEGWAGGFRHAIDYWEIWNEPENRPNMWSGSDEDYFRLYAAAARAIKARFPKLKVGGPSVGATGELVDGRLKPTEFVQGFLEYCRKQELPLDFFSWHTYCDDPRVFAGKAHAVRKLLDEHGFRKTESHLNEWNYLPRNDWGPLSVAGQGLRRQRCFEEIGGAPGAAFVAETLIRLQDSPLDMANYYSGDTNLFGLFNRYGAPRKTFHAMRAFRMLLDTPARVKASGQGADPPAVCAGLNKARTELTILAANFRSAEKQLLLRVEHLPWKGPTRWEVLAVDAERDLVRVRSGAASAGDLRLDVAFEPPCVRVVRVSEAPPSSGPPK